MLVPESWLRAYFQTNDSAEELAHTLTMGGLEVEDVQPFAPAFSGVVVAKIVDIAPHPDADKLRVCQVDDGSGQLLQIVCGAPNAAAGIVVPLAKIGAVLPGNFKISKAKMRGVESFGMLCSARELGISQDHEGLLVLDGGLTLGQCIRQALQLEDHIFTLKMTPNRADCLSMLGVLRELNALTQGQLSLPVLPKVVPTITDTLPVRIDAKDLCGRFAGRVVRGVNAKAPTPAWMKTRLERAGQRSISALVDISNYVMLELGRPTHVFDLDNVGAELIVRWGKSGESLALLNEKTVAIDEQVGVVADSSGVLSLAGIMGGDASAVTLDTQNVYLEAAFWWPDAIAGRSRRFNFSTDAGYRFERGVDFSSIPEHLDYITQLILDICGGQAGPVTDHVADLPKREPVRLRYARCRQILGIDVSDLEIQRVFERLGLSAKADDNAIWVTPPSYRFDMSIEEDLIEEVARVYGFDRIPARLPDAQNNMRSQPETLRKNHDLRHIMVGLDYQEVINFSFVESDWELDYAGNSTPIRLLNPIASQLSVMRSSLIGGLVANVQTNLKRKIQRVRVFEYGRVFSHDAKVLSDAWHVKGVQQPLKLAGLAYGSVYEEQWGVSTRNVDFFDVKADVQALFGLTQIAFIADQHPALHPGRSARIEMNGVTVGWLGELHPAWVQKAELPSAPVVFELDANALAHKALPTVSELSNQPLVSRDLAVWVSESTEFASLVTSVQQMKASKPELQIVQDIRLFDVWRDKSSNHAEKSLALRFSLQDNSQTLSDERVEQAMTIILEILTTKHNVRLRT